MILTTQKQLRDTKHESGVEFKCSQCHEVKPVQTERTKVIFRTWPKSKGGDVIALFPAIAGSVGKPRTCSSYQHVGQHGAATLDLCRTLRLATPAQYKDLASELRCLGYVLDIRKRATRADYNERVKQLS